MATQKGRGHIFDYSDQVVVVTGGASGIGNAAAREIQRGGGQIIVWDSVERPTSDDARADRLVGAEFWSVDVRLSAAVEAETRRVMSEYGRIDVLLNCAGIAGAFERIEDYPEVEWQRVLDVNLTGVFNTCKSVVPFMREANYGRIVNVASIAGKEGNPRQVAYSAAKAGVIALTKSIAKELAETGVTANALAPGVIQTPMANQVTPEDILRLASKVPMGRLGRPEEAGAMLAWIASKDCSFTTGFCFDISGGRATY